MANLTYYSISPFGTGDIKVACNISISGGAGVATFSVAQTGNIGVGCHVISANVDGYISEMTDSTTATIVTALGAAHGNVSSESLTSIKHEYASLSAAEAGFTDASHVNNTDLTAADILVNLCLYYDHVDDIPDSTSVTIIYGTSDSTRYLNIYTPQGGTESINNQRSPTGKWDTTNAWHWINSAATFITSSQDYTRIEGLQADVSANSGTYYNYAVTGVYVGLEIRDCIFLASGSGGMTGILFGGSSDGSSLKMFNTIVYGQGNRGFDGAWSTGTTVEIYGCTFYGQGGAGIREREVAITIKNTVVASTADDFDLDGSPTVDYCASDDGDGTNAQTLDSTSNYANEFTDVTIGDFSLVSGGVCVDNGTDLSGVGVDDDIINTLRPQGSSDDIGAFERVPAGGVDVRRHIIQAYAGMNN